MSQLYTCRDLSIKTGLHIRKIQRLAKAGKIPGAFRTDDDKGHWRFKSDYVKLWLKERGFTE